MYSQKARGRSRSSPTKSLCDGHRLLYASSSPTRSKQGDRQDESDHHDRTDAALDRALAQLLVGVPLEDGSDAIGRHADIAGSYQHVPPWDGMRNAAGIPTRWDAPVHSGPVN